MYLDEKHIAATAERSLIYYRFESCLDYLETKAEMIEGFSKDNIIVCVSHEAVLKDLSDEAWLSGAVYSDRDSDNAKIYTDGITIGKEYRVTERSYLWSHLESNQAGEDPVCHDTVSIINDWGSERYYLSDLFISKSEWRSNKLKEIGI